MTRVSTVLGLGLAFAGVSLAGLTPASAQNSGCMDIQKTLLERKALVEQVDAIQKAKRKPTVQEACALFTKLTTNGATAVKWLEANKDWCAIPDGFAEGFKQDHDKVSDVRAKTCSMAAKAAEAQKKAQSTPQNQLFGGPGLTGSFRMPQGAM